MRYIKYLVDLLKHLSVVIACMGLFSSLAGAGVDRSGEWSVYRNGDVEGCPESAKGIAMSVKLPLNSQPNKFRMFVLHTPYQTLEHAIERGKQLTKGYGYKLVALINGGFFDYDQTPLSFYQGYADLGSRFPRRAHEARNGYENRPCLEYWSQATNKLAIHYLSPNRHQYLRRSDVGVACAGPMLLQKGHDVMLPSLWMGRFHPGSHPKQMDPLNYNNNLPRSAACITHDDALMLFSYQGQNLRCGPTLEQLSRRLKRARCRDAINLDGGGSTAMYAVDPADWHGYTNVGATDRQAPVWIAIGWRNFKQK